MTDPTFIIVSFFASYHRGPKGWEYTMGNFAQQVHPLVDTVSLTIQRINSSTVDHFVVSMKHSPKVTLDIGTQFDQTVAIQV